MIGRIGKGYEKIVYDCHKAGNYWDQAYYEGYLNGVILIGACDMDPKATDVFPFLYLPNAKNELSSVEIYKKELERTTTSKSMYHRFAQKLVEEKYSSGMIMHHPPF